MSKSKTEEQAALEQINKEIYSPGGFYLWAALREGKPWYVRIPTPDAVAEKWMKNERIELVHMCDPTAFVAAMKRQEKKNLARFSGDVKDGNCNNCKASMTDLDNV